jgi:hypothetical protein
MIFQSEPALCLADEGAGIKSRGHLRLVFAEKWRDLTAIERVLWEIWWAVRDY